MSRSSLEHRGERMLKYMAMHIRALSHVKPFLEIKFRKGPALEKYILNLKIPNFRKWPLHNN